MFGRSTIYLLNIRLYNLLDVICKKETVRSKWTFIAITGKQSCIPFINPQTFIKISVGYFPHIRQQLFPPPLLKIQESYVPSEEETRSNTIKAYRRASTAVSLL